MSYFIAHRQNFRRALLLILLFIFPLIYNFFSPYLVMASAAEGVVNGSLIVFGLMFITSLFLGRLWCGWACPAGAVGEVCQGVNDRPVRGRIRWLKWVIWAPWLSGIVALAISAGGYRRVDAMYSMETGLLPTEPRAFIMYYFVLGLFVVVSMLAGRRSVCHTICWMAPFMIIGRWISNRLRLPALRLAASPDKCSNCKKCTSHCPMSLDVNAMVQRADMENSDCILCGTCIDGCTKDAIRYQFSAFRNVKRDA